LFAVFGLLSLQLYQWSDSEYTECSLAAGQLLLTSTVASEHHVVTLVDSLKPVKTFE